MSKKMRVLLFVFVSILSIFYKYHQPEVLKEKDTKLSLTLEGEFNQTGVYYFELGETIGTLIEKVGVSENANLKAVNKDKELVDESRLYLPCLNEQAVSLNYGSQEELMSIKGIGESTALKIIEYRNQQPFECLEDMMNISGIGEKTYLKYRNQLCL